MIAQPNRPGTTVTFLGATTDTPAPPPAPPPPVGLPDFFDGGAPDTVYTYVLDGGAPDTVYDLTIDGGAP